MRRPTLTLGASILFAARPRCGPPTSCASAGEGAAATALLRWYPDEGAPAVPRTVTVDAEPADPRLAYFAAQAYPELGSKSQAEAAIKRGQLRLNGQLASGSTRAAHGDELSLSVAPPKRPAGKKLASTARFVAHLQSQGLAAPYEDEHIAVVFKPAGVHTKRQSNPRFAALEDALPAVVQPSCAREDALPLPLAMHRLDVPVCGLLLVAKTRRGALGLARQLEAREVQKRYVALLVGAPPADPGAPPLEIDAPVGGLAARSTLRTLSVTPHAQWGALSRVELSPLTGRTHQLRVHAAGLGCPILGDDLHWEAAAVAREARREPPLPALRSKGGLFLQSCAVRLAHPITGEALEVVVPAADKFERLSERARRAAEHQQDAPRGALQY